MIDMEMLDAIKGLLEAQTAELKAYVKDEINAALVKNNSAIADIVTESGEKLSNTNTGKIDDLERSIKDVETVTVQNAFDVQLLRRKSMIQP